MSYAKAKQRYEEASGAAEQPQRHVRTDYRCRANGCPNAGCIDDGGEQNRGRCWFHWNEPEPTRWDAVTRRIRDDFNTMRNHGAPMAHSTVPNGPELFEGEPV